MTKPTFHNVQQGTQDWLALKAKLPYSASEAAAMLGRSPYKTRQALVRQIATGGETSIFEPVADEGHRAEAAARPNAEAIAGGTLYPVTASRQIDGLTLLASCDGLSIDGSILWEHKQHNAEDAAEVAAGSVPAKHQPQLEQGMMVTGATRALFMISDGTTDNCEHCWYEPNADLATAIVAGWKALDADIAAYEHVETPAEAVGVMPESLPALLMDITGAVRDTNLATYQQVVSARIQAINTNLQTDQDFADAEKTVKFLKAGEDEIVAAKKAALAQTQSIDELFHAIDELKEEMRAKRLELDKLVKARKETIRAEILADAMTRLSQHAIEIAETFDSRVMALDVPATARQDIAAAMKGKKTITSLRDAAAQAVTDEKLAMNAAADEIRANLKAFDEITADQAVTQLFPDLSALVRKPADDFAAAVKSRIADAAEQERKRVQAERERMLAEDAAKAEAVQHAEPRPPTKDEKPPEVAQQAAPSDERPSVPLGELCTRLGFAVRADFLESLGFTATREKRAMLYRESDWPRICDAIVAHVQKVRGRSWDQAA